MSKTNKFIFLSGSTFVLACDDQTDQHECHDTQIFNGTDEAEEWGEVPTNGGELLICYASSDTENNELNVTGFITALNDPHFECSQSVTILDEDGNEHTFGYTMLDEFGEDLTPDVDLTLDQEISVDHLGLVMNDVTGALIINDVNGLVLAANRGFGTGSLQDETLPFSVYKSARNKKVLVGNDCYNSEFHTVVFEAETNIEIPPFSFSTIELNGTTLDAYAINAVEYGTKKDCEDNFPAGEFHWAVSR